MHIQSRWLPLMVASAGLVIAIGPTPRDVDANSPAHQEKPTKKSRGSARTVEVQLVDGSAMKMCLLEERLELATPYGRLRIPFADICRIDFAWRVSEDDASRLEELMADLGNVDFKRRHLATNDLMDLGTRAYPALLQAAKHPDPEVVRRAELVLDKLRQRVPAEQLEVRQQDVVFTCDSKITGCITAVSIKVNTLAFGEQQLKLFDLRSLQTPGASLVAGEALPDPGTLSGMQGQIGKTMGFKVTGAPAGSTGVWGTGTYTADSTLAVAAVHAGVLRPGQSGVVRVTMVGPVPGYIGSTQNGITSASYGGFVGYRIER